ncbi:MAG TPA: hypothetical protein VK789_15345 [Bryobacteraceae bacterium]|nr:hypothetical protein [Bryobacteraceae bacterium]
MNDGFAQIIVCFGYLETVRLVCSTVTPGQRLLEVTGGIMHAPPNSAIRFSACTLHANGAPTEVIEDGRVISPL